MMQVAPTSPAPMSDAMQQRAARRSPRRAVSSKSRGAAATNGHERAAQRRQLRKTVSTQSRKSTRSGMAASPVLRRAPPSVAASPAPGSPSTEKQNLLGFVGRMVGISPARERSNETTTATEVIWFRQSLASSVTLPEFSAEASQKQDKEEEDVIHPFDEEEEEDDDKTEKVLNAARPSLVKEVFSTTTSVTSPPSIEE